MFLLLYRWYAPILWKFQQWRKRYRAPIKYYVYKVPYYRGDNSRVGNNKYWLKTIATFVSAYIYDAGIIIIFKNSFLFIVHSLIRHSSVVSDPSTIIILQLWKVFDVNPYVLDHTSSKLTTIPCKKALKFKSIIYFRSKTSW